MAAAVSHTSPARRASVRLCCMPMLESIIDNAATLGNLPWLSAIIAIGRHPTRAVASTTGKTLTVRAVVLSEAARLGGCAPGKADAMPPPALVYMNCMSLDGNTLLGRVAEGLQRNMHRTLKQVPMPVCFNSSRLNTAVVIAICTARCNMSQLVV